MDSFPIEIVVPVHDEQETISRTISEFLAMADSRALGIEILVADIDSGIRDRILLAQRRQFR